MRLNSGYIRRLHAAMQARSGFALAPVLCSGRDGHFSTSP
ncbi:hypothetical protein ACVWXN_001746 [Bradyrhizobium sp. i1.4.4]